MIVQIVFDLPFEKEFDYLVPVGYQGNLDVGTSVKVSFGYKKLTGIVIGILRASEIKNLKPIIAIDSKFPTLDQDQIDLAKKLAAYYGCSLGQALFTIQRSCVGQIISPNISEKAQSGSEAYILASESQEALLVKLIKPFIDDKQRILILVADQFSAVHLTSVLIKHFPPENLVVGMRSSVFRSLADIAMVIMIDEGHASYKQEQTPMYETREVLLMRQEQENFKLVFIGAIASVELMHLIQQGKVLLKQESYDQQMKVQLVDLNNYKNLLKGNLSPAVMLALEGNTLKKRKSIVVFNHLGSFALTKCQDCNYILKCQRCESAMVYSRIKKCYQCRYCSFVLPGQTVCPSCHKPSWKSFGLGIEQLQKILQEKWPLLKIETFQRGNEEPLKNFDIMIGTVALLRFKGKLKASLVAILDIDGELNRLDVRSCFRAFALANDFKSMAEEQFFIQSRNPDHYVLQALAKNDTKVFYQEDMRIRQELKLIPFIHQVAIQLRGKEGKIVEKTAQDLFDHLSQGLPPEIQINAPIVEPIAKKRDLLRMNILLQGPKVIDMISLVKKTMIQVKRKSAVIVTLNVD